MRILYITNQISGAAGLERVLSIKASYLADEMNYDVHIVTLNQGNNSLFFDFSDKITLHDISVRGNFFQYVKQYRSGLNTIVKSIKPDVISVCDDGLKAFFLPIVLRKPCPMIYERHVSKKIEIKTDSESFLDKIKSKITFKLMEVLAKNYDRFVVLTQGNTSEWNLKNSTIIPNPLSFYPQRVASLENKTVIAVGKHTFQKGFDRLLQSWQLVNKSHPDWQLAIYGTIDPTQELEVLAEKLGIQNSVQFFPPNKDIQNQYLEASIFVLSSRFEGFGMVLIEAMACGVPCVSFDCPHGPSDIINNAQDGFLVQNGDTAAFATRINQLIEDELMRKKMGANARENVKRFMPENVVKHWDELFKIITK